MNIHEYQAKELLQKFDVATTRGRVASTLDEAELRRRANEAEIDGFIPKQLGATAIVQRVQQIIGAAGEQR